MPCAIFHHAALSHAEYEHCLANRADQTLDRIRDIIGAGAANGITDDVVLDQIHALIGGRAVPLDFTRRHTSGQGHSQ